MSETPHLVLPLLAAAQAQKHVTHNEALASLDALVHLAVKERNRSTAPGSPMEGDRYLVGVNASGDFAGRDGEVALFDLGVWRFFTPRPGWRAYVEAEETFILFDGAQWKDIGHFARELAHVQRLGIGTTADNLNRLSARLNAALFSASPQEEGGTGDLRFVLNKSTAAHVISQLYQQDYSGRAETGLIGSDDFSIRVSPDGSQWRDALLVDRNTGVVTFPNGLSNLPGRNFLINGTFRINERRFPGGSLSEGSFGYDRWKAGPGGCTLAASADGMVTLTGSVEQIVDAAEAAYPYGKSNLGGATLTLSIESPSLDLTVTVGARSSTIVAGAGRLSATITLDDGETGNITVRLQSSAPCSFRRVKLELGPHATPWFGKTLEAEQMRCRRYFQRLPAGNGSPFSLSCFGQRVADRFIDLPVVLPVTMRDNPGIVTSGFTWSNGSPTGNRIAFYEPGGATWVTLWGSLSVTGATPVGPSSLTLRLQAGTSFSSTAGTVGSLHFGSSAYVALQAEL